MTASFEPSGEIPIVLTGTIIPQGAALQEDPAIRLAEYVQNITHCLQYAPVIFLENSDYPLEDHSVFQAEPRLRLIKLEPSRNPERGKGYQEFEMIDNWLANDLTRPKILAENHWKILMVNLPSILSECRRDKGNAELIIDQAPRSGMARTYMFYIGSDFYNRQIKGLYQLCDDRSGAWIERILFQKLRNFEASEVRTFATQPKINARAGASNTVFSHESQWVDNQAVSTHWKPAVYPALSLALKVSAAFMRVAILTTDMRSAESTGPIMGIAPQALLEGLAEFSDLEIHVVSCVQVPVQVAKTKVGNIVYHTLHVPKLGWLRTFYQGCIRAVRKKLREIKPDLVHAHGTERECALCAVHSGFPNVVTIHGNMRALSSLYKARPGTYLWLAAMLEGYTLPRTRGVICNSTYTEAQTVAIAKRIWRAPNAVRKKFFETPINPAARSPNLLNIGTVTPHKCQLELLGMATRLWNRGLRFKMQFVGGLEAGTAYSEEFSKQIREAEAVGYAQFLGPLDLENLITTMDQSIALVHWAKEESFGLVIAEALARNLKLISTSTGGIADAAAGAEGVRLIPLGHWEEFENVVADWLSSGCERPSNAAALMRERYHPLEVAKQHLAIYREALGIK